MNPILTQDDLENAALRYGVLPFFPNPVKGLSVEELTTPRLLFGGNEYEGCWEWKGPVVRRRTTAYGKFFRRKAGFISRELLPHFLNWRRSLYSPSPASKEEMVLDIISINDRLTSTELRESILGTGHRRRTAADLPWLEPDMQAADMSSAKTSRHSLEGPLQRLQMGGYICISDFRYKTTRRGERYGWGVAEYSTPEACFESSDLTTALSPAESLEYIVDYVGSRVKSATEKQILQLLKA